jgi:hypothetical protein
MKADHGNLGGDVGSLLVSPPARVSVHAGVNLTGTLSLLGGVGVPPASLGANGDFYFRQDSAGASTRIYVKSAGAWAGIL